MFKHLIIFVFISVTLQEINGQQDFKITLEKIDLLSYNKDYIKDVNFAIFQYNSTHQAMNGSGYLLQDLGFQLKDNIEVYGTENEKDPRLISTMNDVNVCDILTSGYPEIEEMFKIGNFSKCPMKKGFYIATNAILDTTNVPPSVPRGKFMIDIKSFNDGTELLHTQTHATVVDV